MTAETVKGASGRTYTRERLLGEGATGSAWLARPRGGGGASYVMKLFAERFRTPAMRQRVKLLVDHRLDQASPALCGPFEIVDGPRGFGHVAPLAPGVPLDAYLEAPTGTFLDQIIAAGALAAGLAVMERRSLSHGDLHAGNVMMHHHGGVLRASVIDLDNVVAPGLPAPPAIGQINYYAPEIRGAPALARPTASSDRYALGVLMHELLLGRHPAAAVQLDADKFDHVMTAGGWPDDPAGAARAGTGEAEGLPVDCLDTRLQNLLRRALGKHPEARPNAADWLAALSQARDNVFACDFCRRPMLIDGGKTRCPHCGRGFAAYRLSIGKQKPITLDRAPLSLTREVVGDAGRSGTRAVLRRNGPDAILEPTGRVPVWRLGAAGPVPLEPGLQHLLRPRDRLRIGEVDAEVAIDLPAPSPPRK